MSTMEDVDPRSLYTMMKGEPGLRKSTAAVSYPTPQFWFSWDRKMSSLLIPMRNWGIDRKLIHYEDYNNWDAPKKRLDEFKLKCPYSTLVFDSVTSMADMTLRQTRSTKGGSGRKIGSIQVDDIEDFNAESAAINELIATTKDIQSYWKTQGRHVNIILIAHVMEVTYRNLNNPIQVSRTIVTAGKRVAAKIPAYCGEVYHFGIEKGFVEGSGGTYVAITENNGDDFARTALPLDKILKIGDKPLYKEFILPAIEKLEAK